MNRNFKVGDRVRIRNWDDMTKEYGLDWEENIATPYYFFVQEMGILCGVEATITEISGEHIVLNNFSEYEDFAKMWNYSIFMIEKI